MSDPNNIIDLFGPLDPEKQSEAFRAGLKAVSEIAPQDNLPPAPIAAPAAANQAKNLFAVAAAFVCEKARLVIGYLRRSARLGAIVALAMLPISCAPVSPEMQRIQADCALEAQQKVPPRLAYALDPGTAFSTSSCHKGNCTSYSNYTPPHVEPVDINAPLREQVTDACIARHAPKPDLKP